MISVEILGVFMWPPNYDEVFRQRIERLQRLRKNPNQLKLIKEYYSKNPKDFINDWVCTYDPRNALGGGTNSFLPFCLFPLQNNFIDFLNLLLDQKQKGLVEKSRDMGFTWLCCGFAVWLWLFWPGSSVGFGSRKAEYVDEKGDPDSIFEKIRIILRYLPHEFLPKGYDEDKHALYMKVLNPENGATISGEAGDSIGRGGRKSIYFKDESAFYERPKKIEAALGDNTNVQVDISTVNGINLFYQRRKSGLIWAPEKKILEPGRIHVFIADWRDHPLKTQEWYDTRRRAAELEGTLAEFSREIDRDYVGAVENTVIPTKFIKAAIDAHKLLNIVNEGQTFAGLDVKDTGRDKHALVVRKGILVKFAESWADGDAFFAAQKAHKIALEYSVNHLEYDSIGVGAAAKGAFNQMQTGKMVISPWGAAEAALNPEANVIQNDLDSPKNRDFYANLKAQGWWELRRRFENTYRIINGLDVLDSENIISIPSNLQFLNQLEEELSQVQYKFDPKHRLVIDKTPEGTKSPNIADALVMAFWPKESKSWFFV